MKHFTVVADYQSEPAEGIQVISKTLIDGLRGQGNAVQVIAPSKLFLNLPRLIMRRPRLVVFTHGPGKGVVLASAALRLLTRARILWVATRPDLHRIPRWMRGLRTAHVIVCNRTRTDLQSVARDAHLVQQFIGINPDRLGRSSNDKDPWPELSATGRPVALHVGHLKRNRGLDLLVAVKLELQDQVEIIVQGSPAFPPDAGIVEELVASGIHVRRLFVPNLANLYEAADLYLFPVRSEAAGAIELPLGVIEAIACGCPVLTNEFGALLEAVGSVPGVTFTKPERFVRDFKYLIENQNVLAIRPPRLPDRLHAQRITDAILEHSGLNDA